MEVSKEMLEKLILESNSKNEICKKLKISSNGKGYKKITDLAIKYELSFEGFKISKNHFVKYEKIIKKCPVCDLEFETKLGSKNEKKTCSHSCSNTYFRSGENNPNYKNVDDFDIKSRSFSKKYRSICFANHEHKCVVCEEKLLLDVHHFDGNRSNNNPENLIPLCATHHNYWHSNYRYVIEEKVLSYVKNLKRDVD